MTWTPIAIEAALESYHGPRWREKFGPDEWALLWEDMTRALDAAWAAQAMARTEVARA